MNILVMIDMQVLLVHIILFGKFKDLKEAKEGVIKFLEKHTKNS